MAVSKDDKPFDLYDLKVFMAAATLSSFKEAGASTGLSQSAVSMSVMRLEKRTGIKLFQKAGRTTELTQAGTMLYTYARTLLMIAEDAVEALSELADS